MGRGFGYEFSRFLPGIAQTWSNAIRERREDEREAEKTAMGQRAVEDFIQAAGLNAPPVPQPADVDTPISQSTYRRNLLGKQAQTPEFARAFLNLGGTVNQWRDAFTDLSQVDQHKTQDALAEPRRDFLKYGTGFLDPDTEQAVKFSMGLAPRAESPPPEDPRTKLTSAFGAQLGHALGKSGVPGYEKFDDAFIGNLAGATKKFRVESGQGEGTGKEDITFQGAVNESQQTLNASATKIISEVNSRPRLSDRDLKNLDPKESRDDYVELAPGQHVKYTRQEREQLRKIDESLSSQQAIIDSARVFMGRVNNQPWAAPGIPEDEVNQDSLDNPEWYMPADSTDIPIGSTGQSREDKIAEIERMMRLEQIFGGDEGP